MSNLDRFNAKYQKSESGCWEWTGYRLPKGYGKFRMGGKMELAHRAAWVLFNGEIPAGMAVCHRCDNPKCVNPGHLFLGTTQDNASDMVAKGRSTAGERSHLAKLTKDQVQSIKETPGPRDQVAAKYGVSGSLVSYIRRGDIWKGTANV